MKYLKYLKYLVEFVFVIICFIIFIILGAKKSSNISGKIFEKIGPIFRSKKIIHKNIKKAFPEIDLINLNKFTKEMWNNYGRTFAEYIFIKNFRSGKLSSNITIEGEEFLIDIVKSNKQVIFISGHLSNFELMAMYLEKSGVKLSAIYRPLNNIFINPIIEMIRKNYICKNQIKKGLGGVKKLINLKKQNFSTALMIDQRVSEGTLSKFFNEKAFTTTIPAQLVKKFNIPVVPVFIERTKEIEFKIKIYEPLNFNKDQTIQNITDKLNQVLEKMILKKPEHWIWSHNRWK